MLFKKNLNRKCLRYLEVHLTDHCNLNCANCCHFAPIAKPYFMPIEHFNNDLARLSSLSNGNIKRISLMGGEPLLHPQIIDFMDISRLYFPHSEIEIHSNGIILTKMPEEFWRSCATNAVTIVISYYPVGIDYTHIYELAISNGVRFKTDIDTSKKLFRNFRMDLSGKQNYRRSWFLCTHANSSVNLYEGRLYTCDIAAHSKHLSDYFNLSLAYSENDYIDIYKEDSMKSILKKLNKPHPFCRYCRPNQSRIEEWHLSKRDLNEWAD